MVNFPPHTALDLATDATLSKVPGLAQQRNHRTLKVQKEKLATIHRFDISLFMGALPSNILSDLAK